MSNNAKSEARWDTANLIRLGVLIGLFAAVLHHFYYALQNEVPEGNLYVYVVARMVIYALAGGLVFGGISFLHNRITLGK